MGKQIHNWIQSRVYDKAPLDPEVEKWSAGVAGVCGMAHHHGYYVMTCHLMQQPLNNNGYRLSQNQFIHPHTYLRMQ